MINRENLYIKNFTHYIILIVGIFLCTYLSIKMKPIFGLIFGALPILIISILFVLRKTSLILIILLLTNYLIMGATKYIDIPIPISNIFDLLFGIIVLLSIINLISRKANYNNIINPYIFLMFAWLLFCIISVFNNTTGTLQIIPWIKTIRPMALYPLIVSFIVSVNCKHYSYIKKFLFIWAILTLFASIKCIIQYKIGFDNSEWRWLMTIGRNTHMISSGIRYFSFFTDAANFGCSMGFSFVVFIIIGFLTRHKKIKLFYYITAALALYTLLLSGTRSAIAIPFAGLGLFVILIKKWKLMFSGMIILLSSIIIINYTTIGNSNQHIRRMRTAFDTNDASFQVRMNNQKALKSYMKQAPFGIGIGVGNGDLSSNNKFYFVSICAPDSDFVYIWMHLGIIGLTIYIIIQLLVYTTASIYILFKIRNKEIKVPVTAMLCGSAGLLVASYANMVSFQYPNSLLLFTCLTFVFLGPYFDKQYTKEHEKEY